MAGASRFDLVVRARRVVDVARGLDGPGAVAIAGDRIVAAGPGIAGTAVREIDAGDAVLLPGLIDIHTHPARAGSKYGVDPDVEFLPRGATTVLSQGDAGASNWRAYRAHTIESSKTRVRLAINLAAPGESTDRGCFADMAEVNVEACVGAIEEGADLIWGIAVNVGSASETQDAPEVVRRAREVADRVSRPLLYGIREPHLWPLESQMGFLRAGDVVTYCFREPPHSIMANGRIDPAAWRARERGVLFDVGHGMRAFDFGVAEAALREGFPPDTISTDQYRRHLGSRPQHDLPRVMAKLRAVGMPEPDIFAAVTARPARVLRLEGEVGTLALGACADLVGLRFDERGPTLADVGGNERAGGCWEAVLVVRGGEVIRAIA